MNNPITSQTSRLPNPRSAAAPSASAGHPPVEPWRRALAKYAAAVSVGATPDLRAVPSLLKACAAAGVAALAVTLHQRAVVSGHHRDPYVASSLIHAYAKLGQVASARRVFDEMSHRTAVPWSAIIVAYSHFSGDPNAAMAAYQRMRRAGVEPNAVTLLGLLAGIREAAQLQCLHGATVRSGLLSHLPVANSMVNVYLRLGRASSARRLFDSMGHRDVVSWNTMISGYSRAGAITESVELFKMMMEDADSVPDRRTFSSLVSCAAAAGSVLVGRSIHGLIITSGVDLDDRVVTSLLTMYLKQKNLSYGYLLFDLASNKDSIFWTAMTAGLVQNDRADEALKLFPRALTSGEETLGSVAIASLLAACGQLGSLNLGASIHGYLLCRSMIPIDPQAENSLISMYSKCGRMRQSQHLFWAMQERDLVSWNSVISGFVQNGDLELAFRLLEKMMGTGLRPDSITVLLLLKGSASLGSLRHGRPLHGFLVRNQQWPATVATMTALVDMYCKCGELRVARSCFDSIMAGERDLVSWSSMIAGYGCHGRGEAALELFSAFLSSGIRPNRVVFLAALSACSHAGLVGDGLRIFRSMAEDFGLSPEMEHCACVVDLLGRAGMLREAAAVARSTPTSEVLGILLDASRIHGDAALAEEVAGEILAMEPAAAGSYVQLAQGFAAANRWDGVGESWARMRSLGLKKTPGWSSVQVNDATTATFFVGQPLHPQHGELTSLLRNLYEVMRSAADDDDKD